MSKSFIKSFIFQLSGSVPFKLLHILGAVPGVYSIPPSIYLYMSQYCVDVITVAL